MATTDTTKSLATKTFLIDGMTCPACETRVGKALANTPGVTTADVDYACGTARVTFDPALTGEAALTAAIEALDYRVRAGTAEREDVPSDYSFYRAATLLAVIIALYLLVRQFGLLNLAAAFPLAEAGAGYAALCAGSGRYLDDHAVDIARQRSPVRPSGTDV